MNSAMILLLDFDPAEGFCEVLRKILEPPFRLHVGFPKDYFEIRDPAFLRNELSRSLMRYNPGMILLVLSQTLFKQASLLLQAIRQLPSQVPIIVIVSAGEPDNMLELLKVGASDFITLPLKAIDILPRVWRLLERNQQVDAPESARKERLGMKPLVGVSPAFIAETKKFPLVAKCDASLLMLGETGTGKELCARKVHSLSPRADRPFIPVNCGAMPLELIENELFGHEREAFTGASTSRLGLIFEANGGTLFLDEIDCLPMLAQVKLLRFLQDKEYRPLGSMKMRQADVRVMAATNIDLEEAVRKGAFRQDLYYRLSVISLILPPLRERQEDILLLAQHFLAKYTEKFNKRVTGFSPDAIRKLLLHDWPGNVRELEHVIERAIVLCEHEILRSDDICLPRLQSVAPQGSFQQVKARMIAQFERAYIQGLLLAYQGNITRAAEAAQKDRRALRHLIRKHKIDVQSFKPGV